MDKRIIKVRTDPSREERLSAIKMTLIRFNAFVQEMDSQRYYSPRKFTAEQRDFLYEMADRQYLGNMNAVLMGKQLEELDDEALEKVLEKCRRLSDGFALCVDIPKGAEIADGKETGAWKIYLDADNKISRIKYGSDKTRAQIIKSNGTAGTVIKMDESIKGFAKRLLAAAGLEVTPEADMEMQERMLDDGLFYINKEEGWIEKQNYFERMTPKDFREMRNYKEVMVKAVYTDSKQELVFYYSTERKTNELFTIKASNEQKKRKFPTASGNKTFSKHDEMKTTPPIGYFEVDYIPTKFPRGEWKITAFEENGTENYGPFKIRTDAWRYVDVWEPYLDKENIQQWRKKTDENGRIVQTKDVGLLIHGGTGRKIENLTEIEKLDARIGDNNYTDTTLGCIRISNLDVYLIVEVLTAYLKIKGHIPLEVK